MAIKHKTHIDTVLAYREQYLQDVGCQETLQQFMQYAGKVPHTVKSDIIVCRIYSLSVLVMGQLNLECNWIHIAVCM